MVGKRHNDLLRDIKGYKEVIDQNANSRSANFFIESTYKNDNNQSYSCYLLTKKGCDMVANKMTGEKGESLMSANFLKTMADFYKKPIDYFSCADNGITEQLTLF